MSVKERCHGTGLPCEYAASTALQQTLLGGWQQGRRAEAGARGGGGGRCIAGGVGGESVGDEQPGATVEASVNEVVPFFTAVCESPATIQYKIT